MRPSFLLEFRRVKEIKKTNYIQRIARVTLAYGSEAKDSRGGWNRLIASSSCALDLFMKLLLYVSDVWIETAQATRIASAGRHFWRLTLA